MSLNEMILKVFMMALLRSWWNQAICVKIDILIYVRSYLRLLSSPIHEPFQGIAITMSIANYLQNSINCFFINWTEFIKFFAHLFIISTLKTYKKTVFFTLKLLETYTQNIKLNNEYGKLREWINEKLPKARICMRTLFNGPAWMIPISYSV